MNKQTLKAGRPTDIKRARLLDELAGTSEDDKKLNVMVPKAMHDKIKKIAINQGTTVKQLVKDWIKGLPNE